MLPRNPLLIYIYDRSCRHKLSLFLTVVLFHFGRIFPLADFETQHSPNNAVNSIKPFRSSVISAA